MSLRWASFAFHNGKFIVPHRVLAGGTSALDVRPVVVLDKEDMDGLCKLLRSRIGTVFEIVPFPTKKYYDAMKGSEIWRDTGARSVRQYMREAREWEIAEDEIHFSLIPKKMERAPENKFFLTDDNEHAVTVNKADGLERFFEVVRRVVQSEISKTGDQAA